QRIRKMFRRMGWFMPLLRPTGLTPRMTVEQMANCNIELGVIARERELGPVLDNITVPVLYVLASGTSLGSHGDEQERVRASLDAVVASNPNMQISAKVASNHDAILKKDFHAVADAVREVAAVDRQRGLQNMTSGLIPFRNLTSNPEMREVRSRAQALTVLSKSPQSQTQYLRDTCERGKTAVGEVCFAQLVPHMLDGIQLGAGGRLGNQADMLWDDQVVPETMVAGNPRMNGRFGHATGPSHL